MNLAPQIIPNLSPFQVIQTTYKVVRKRRDEAKKAFQEGSTFLEKFEAMKNLEALEEFESHLRFCLHYPDIWDQVGRDMREAYMKVQDPSSWVGLIRGYLRDVVTSRPVDAVIH